MLYAVTKVLTDHPSDIKYVDIRAGESQSEIYFEFTLGTQDLAAVLADLRAVPGIASAEETPTFNRIYGKRIVVMGGGAQVGMVAMGAVARTAAASSCSPTSGMVSTEMRSPRML